MNEKSTFIKLREDEREVRKTLIMDAAKKLYGEKPFHEIGMRDIATSAGVSAATIYRYFPSRDDLFVEALIQDMNNIEALLERRLKAGQIPIEEFALVAVDYFMDNEATFQMMCHFMIDGGINPRVLNKFNAVQMYFVNMLDELMKRSGAQGESHIYNHAFFASLTGVVMTFRNYPGLSKEEKRQYMHRLALAIIRGADTTAFLENGKK